LVRGSPGPSSSIFAVMGNDGAGGSLELVGGSDESDGDGAIRVRWPDARDLRVFRDGIDALRDLGIHSGIDGEVQANSGWQLLTTDLQFLFDDKRGPLLTVHPLGGCPMGDTPFDEQAEGEDKGVLRTRGVVNHIGQVFNGAPRPHEEALFRNLLVLDGSIVPTSLGINPSLTIAALSHRAVEAVREEWGWKAPPDEAPPAAKRPNFQTIPEPQPVVP